MQKTFQPSRRFLVPSNSTERLSPKAGSIKSKAEIRRIKKLLADNHLALAFFCLGINTAFRASDLLQIKVKDVKKLQPGDVLEIKEQKTGKRRTVNLNQDCITVIRELLASKCYEGEQPPL